MKRPAETHEQTHRRLGSAIRALEAIRDAGDAATVDDLKRQARTTLITVKHAEGWGR